MSGNYWARRQISRRAMLRAGGLGVAGLAGAVLLGCGGSEDTSDGGTSGGSSGASGASTSAASSGGGGGAGLPTIARAPGFDPALGVTPVNEKPLKPGGTFRRRVTDTTRQQDPDISIAGSDHEYVNDRLFFANGWTQELTPDLLESYELTDPEGLEIVLKLRPGIKTHDIDPVNGRDFTAEDVAYSIMRKAGKLDAEEAAKYARAGQFVGLDKAEAVDNVTVRLTFSQPNGAVLAAFADPRAQMIPREQDDIGYSDPTKFVGTGAWIQTEFVEGTRQVFSANPNYYRTAEEGGRPPYDTFEKLVIADRASEISAFITGEVTTIAAVQPHERTQIESSVEGAQWFAQPNYGWYHWAVNKLVNPAFADTRVRQALQLSINYTELGNAISEGWLFSGPLHVMFAEAMKSDEVGQLPGYNPATRDADVEKAAQLMDAAGFPKGSGLAFKTQISGSSGTTFDNGVRLQDNWSKIFPDLKMELTPVTDYASFTNLLNQREFETRSYHHTMVPNAAIDARTYYHSQGGRNYQSFEEPWADEALDKMLAAQTLQERIDIIRPFEKRYIEEGPPLLQLLVSRDLNAFQPNWAGMDLVAGTWAYGLATYGVGPRWYWQTE